MTRKRERCFLQVFIVWLKVQALIVSCAKHSASDQSLFFLSIHNQGLQDDVTIVFSRVPYRTIQVLHYFFLDIRYTLYMYHTARYKFYITSSSISDIHCSKLHVSLVCPSLVFSNQTVLVFIAVPLRFRCGSCKFKCCCYFTMFCDI